MKKKISILLLVILFPFTMISVQAASARVSQSKSQVYVGETVTITVSTPGKDDGLQGNMSVSGPGSLNTNAFVFYEGGSTSFTVKANAVGKIVVSITGKGETWEGDPISLNTSISINVINKPAPNPTPTNPTTPSNPKPTTPTAPSKTPEQIAKEKEEAEKAAKEAEKAKAQKTPLVSEIKLFSNSVKLYNEMINEVKPEFDKWDYSYNLPKRIDKVFINVKAVDPNTVLTFDETFDFNDIEGNDYTFEVRAKLGDIEQVIKYKITKDTSVPATVNFNGADYTILEDELLDKHMVDSSGFKRLTFKDADDKEIPYYEMGSLKLQPVLDGNNKASWVLLDEAFKVVREVVITFDKSNRPFIIFNAPEEIASKTVQGKSYSDEAIEIQEILNSIDENITWNNAIKSWKLDSGSILYGMDDTGKEGNFYLDSEGNIGFAIVTYDEKEAIDYKMWAYISTGVAAVLAASLVSYIIVNNKQKKRVIKEV